MLKLSTTTSQLVSGLFAADLRDEAAGFLANDCADNLPFSEDADELSIERVRFAALKLSGGDLERLLDAIQLAQTDWRDLLVAAGFAEDVSAHNAWASETLRQT